MSPLDEAAKSSGFSDQSTFKSRKSSSAVPLIGRASNAITPSFDADFGCPLRPNLVTTFNEFMSIYGFHLIRTKFSRADQRNGERSSSINWKFPLLVAALWLDFAWCSVQLVFNSDDDQFLLRTGDYAYYMVDKKYRFLVHLGSFMYRLVGVWVVTTYMVDDYQWLADANREYEHINVLTVPRARLGHLYKQFKMFNWFSTVANFVVVVAFQWYGSGTIRQELPAEWNVYWLYAAMVYHGLAMSVHTYLTIVAVSKYYVFYLLVHTFIKQMQLHVLVPHVNNIRSQSDQLGSLVYALKQYSRFYILVHQFNVYLVKAYTVITLSMVGNCFAVYVLMSKTSDLLVYKLFYVGIFMLLFAVYTFFTKTSSQVDDDCREASDCVFHCVCLDRSVCRLLVQDDVFSRELVNYFGNTTGNTIGLVVMNTAINIRTLITVRMICGWNGETRKKSNHGAKYSDFHF